jgi:hypothetical protein
MGEWENFENEDSADGFSSQYENEDEPSSHDENEEW